MDLTLPDLPYDPAALEPHVSARTLEFHHGKHHRTYVDTTKKLIEGTRFERMDLASIIVEAAHDSAQAKLFNNAAQVWNHTFLWHSMTPEGGGKPSGRVAELIDRDLGGYDEFGKAFTEAATTQFGSGWAWLVVVNDKLAVRKTGNAGNPLVAGETPLVTLDVWEHAYYLDYQNRRPDYVGAFLRHLINWDFANRNLENPLR